MENEEKKENAPDGSELGAGDKFWKECDGLPYTNDKVGQVFVRVPFRRYSVEKEDEKKSKSKDLRIQDIVTLEDAAEFLKQLREAPYDTSKEGQIVIIKQHGESHFKKEERSETNTKE